MSIKDIKEKYTCFDILGKPVKKTKNGYLYRAPWRTDSHPSLSVTENGKGWQDLATGAHGSVIDLVMMKLNTSDIKRVIEEILGNEANSSSFYQPILDDNGEKKKGDVFTKFEVVKLQSKGLFAYLYKRKINLNIAKQFLQEAHYSFKEGDSYLYALAYPNDLGGYELRGAPYKSNPDGYKGGTSPKGITTHLTLNDVPIIVFEGFFDMLSFATLCGGVKHNYVVLNSIVNCDAATKLLKTFQTKIYLCLDNDEGGSTTTTQMLDQLPGAIDIRNRFLPYKDVNEYLCAIRQMRNK